MSADEAAWDAFATELAQWRAAGRTATFWWRDDDAGRPDPVLGRLLGLAGSTGVPLGLAVVPAWLDVEVAAALRAAPPSVAVLQHGWAHANHEPTPLPGAGKLRPAECGAGRPPAVALAEIEEGGQRLRASLGERVLPILVPPWNRIAPAVRAALPGLGYRALSAFGPRDSPPPVPGLGVLNCHADPVLWREGKRFAGAAMTLQQLGAHLAGRRTGRVDPTEPTGLLTHHRDMTEGSWAFLDEWLGRLRQHPAVAFPPIPTLMAHAVS